MNKVHLCICCRPSIFRYGPGRFIPTSPANKRHTEAVPHEADVTASVQFGAPSCSNISEMEIQYGLTLHASTQPDRQISLSVNGGSKPGRRGGVKASHWIVT